MIVRLVQGWFPVPDKVCEDLGIREGTEAELEVFDGGVLILTLKPVKEIPIAGKPQGSVRKP